MSLPQENSMPGGETQPDLQLLPEADPTGAVFPDYEFDLPLRKLVGNEVIDVYHASRIRVVVSTVARTSGDDLAEHGEEPDNYRFNENHLKRTRNYMGQSVTVVNSETGQKEKTRRSEAAGQDEVIGEVFAELEEQNHPVAQILNFIRDNYNTDKEDKGLTDGELKALARDVITTTHWNRLKVRYDENVAARRNPAEGV